MANKKKTTMTEKQRAQYEKELKHFRETGEFLVSGKAEELDFSKLSEKPKE